MRPLRAYLRSLDPRLPRAIWILQGGGLANAFGNGIVLPFLIIYLHNVRGISLGAAGLVAATNSAAALGSGFLAGALAGGAIMARRGVRAGRKTAVPFGPFLVAGGLFALFAGAPIVDWYARTFL